METEQDTLELQAAVHTLLATANALSRPRSKSVGFFARYHVSLYENGAVAACPGCGKMCVLSRRRHSNLLKHMGICKQGSALLRADERAEAERLRCAGSTQRLPVVEENAVAHDAFESAVGVANGDLAAYDAAPPGHPKPLSQLVLTRALARLCFKLQLDHTTATSAAMKQFVATILSIIVPEDASYHAVPMPTAADLTQEADRILAGVPPAGEEALLPQVDEDTAHGQAEAVPEHVHTHTSEAVHANSVPSIQDTDIRPTTSASRRRRDEHVSEKRPRAAAPSADVHTHTHTHTHEGNGEVQPSVEEVMPVSGAAAHELDGDEEYVPVQRTRSGRQSRKRRREPDWEEDVEKWIDSSD